MCAEETREQLIEAVESLPARDRLVITLYYFEGMTFREIGAVLKVTESRVCQIQKAVLRDLRARLTKWENIP
jgi:RNA polymerase sigma factor for flagellar operon FliA